MESPRVRLLPLLMVEITGVVILHLLGRERWTHVDWSHLGDWVGSTPPEDAIAAVLRVIALAIAYWLLATTAAYSIGRLSGFPAGGWPSCSRTVGSFTSKAPSPARRPC